MRPTPLEPSVALSEASGREVLLKLESQQRTGSFKVRGALNAVASLAGGGARPRDGDRLGGEPRSRGGARRRGSSGARATVFVPADAPGDQARRGSPALGAELRLVDGDYDDAHHAAEAHAERERRPLPPRLQRPARWWPGRGPWRLEVFAGAAAGRERSLVPVGGGGLIGGMGVVARALGPGVRVIGVQSAATPAMHASLPRGPPGLAHRWARPSATASTATPTGAPWSSPAGWWTRWCWSRRGAVRAAIRWLYVEEGVVAEGSGAVAAAALWNDLVGSAPGPVAAVVTGSNLDASRLATILGE